MSNLPKVYSYPTERLMRCPRILEMAADYFELPIEILSDGFYDLLELSVVTPDDFPPFNWFVISEDAENPNLLWFSTELGSKLAIQLEEIKIDDDDDDNRASLLSSSELNMSSAVAMAITDALREKIGDNEIIPILKEMPMPSNNYLFSSPGVVIGEFKIDESENYKPFIIQDLGEDYIVSFDHQEYTMDYSKYLLADFFGVNTDEITVNDVHVNEQTIGGDFSINNGPRDIFTIVTLSDGSAQLYIASDTYTMMLQYNLAEYHQVDEEEIKILELPSLENNYLLNPEDKTFYVQYNLEDTTYTATIKENSDMSYTTTVSELCQKSES